MTFQLWNVMQLCILLRNAYVLVHIDSHFYEKWFSCLGIIIFNIIVFNILAYTQQTYFVYMRIGVCK